LAADE
jgi:hypothetical protein